MQANQLTMDKYQGMGQINVASQMGDWARGFAGLVNGWLNRLVGCRHKDMSRPFSSQGQTYRACLDCGARRQFNLGRWQMQGSFYYNLPTFKSQVPSPKFQVSKLQVSSHWT